MRGVALMIGMAACAGFGVGLSGCTNRDPYVATPKTTTSGHWKIEQQEDRITGVPVPSAMNVITNASNSFADRAQPASLQLTCFEGKPLVRFAFEFKVGTDSSSSLGYRFDDKPGHDNVPSRFLQEYKTVVIEDRNEVARFVSEMAGANVLVMRVRSLSAGRTTAEFKLEGSGAAVDAAFAGCPLTPASQDQAKEKPRKRTRA